VYGGVAIVIVAAGMFFIFHTSPVPVEMGKVSRQTVREYIAEDAKTRLDKDYIVDMPINGTVERIGLEEGDKVKKGDVVARIDPYDLQQQIKGVEALIKQSEAQIVGVDEAKPKPETIQAAELRVQEAHDNANIARKQHAIAETNFNNAEKEYKRIKALADKDVVSQSQYDSVTREYHNAQQALAQAELSVKAAEKNLSIAEKQAKRVRDSVNDNEYMRTYYQAEKQRYEAQLSQFKDDLKKTDIVSPVTGVVTDKYVDDRRVLPAGSELLKIGNLKTIEIESDILSEEVGRISLGDPVEISGKALGNRTIEGKVERIYPSGFKKISSLGIEQQRVKVIIAFDNDQARLRPGTSVDIRVVTDESKNALAVPERGTFRQQNEWYVFVVKGGRAEQRKVKIGLRNDDWAEILDGVKEGETVIAEPRNDISNGTRVTRLD